MKKIIKLTEDLSVSRYLLGIFGLYLLGIGTCMAEAQRINDTVVLYDEPPSAYQLAKILYPPKMRTIVLDQEPSEIKKTDSVAFMIKFEYDSVVVQNDSLAYLDSLGDMLNFEQLKYKSIQIEGHADASGDEHYNLQLSEARARSIKEYLESVHRISPERLKTLGYGETKLLDHSHPTAEINRRAEFRPISGS